jgi:hypothetical protein
MLRQETNAVKSKNQIRSLRETESILNISLRQLHRLISAGVGPAVILLGDRGRGISDADREAWVAARRQLGRAAAA